MLMNFLFYLVGIFFFQVLSIVYCDECNNSCMDGVLRIRAICILLLILRKYCAIMVG